MEIIYCDGCGFRIPDEDLKEGRAARAEDKSLCAKCLAATPPKKQTFTKLTPASKRATGVIPRHTPASGETRPAHPPHDPTRPASVEPTLPRKSSTLVGFIAGGAAAGIVVALLVFGQNKAIPPHNELLSQHSELPRPQLVVPSPQPEAPNPPIRIEPGSGTPNAQPGPAPETLPKPEAHGPSADAVTQTLPKPPAPEPEPEPEPEPADPDKRAERAYERLAPTLAAADRQNLIALLEAFINQHDDTPAGNRARRWLIDLKDAAGPIGTATNTSASSAPPNPQAPQAAPQPVPLASAPSQPSLDGPQLLASFELEYLALLHKGQLENAQTRLSDAEKQPALKPFEKELQLHRTPLRWLEELEKAVPKGAARLKDIDELELTLTKGEPLRVGKSAKTRVREVKDGNLILLVGGATMPVALSSLSPASRQRLGLLALEQDPNNWSIRLFLEMLTLAERQTSIPLSLKTRIARLKTPGAADSDAYLQRLLIVLEKAHKENAAAKAFKELQKLTEGKPGDALKAATAAFNNLHGSTLLALQKRKELKAIAALSDPLNDGLLAHWTFDETVGHTAIDATDNKNDATLSAGAALEEGKSGQAVSLDGEKAFVTLPEKLIQARTTLTFACWFKTSSCGVILGYQSGAVAEGSTHYVPALAIGQDGRLRGKYWDGSAGPLTAAKLNDATWHHVALVGDKTTQVLFVDGLSAGTTTGNIDHLQMFQNQLGTGNTALWEFGNNKWHFFKGLLDEVRLYGRALSEAEIQSLAGKKKP